MFKNWHFWTTYPILSVHVVIECPLTSKQSGRLFQIFLAFSEYLNSIWIPYARHYKPRLIFFFTQFSLQLRLILQTIYVLKTEILHFLSLKSAAYKRERLQNKSGLWWRAYGIRFISNGPDHEIVSTVSEWWSWRWLALSAHARALCMPTGGCAAKARRRRGGCVSGARRCAGRWATIKYIWPFLAPRSCSCLEENSKSQRTIGGRVMIIWL